jgi:hypothetical protein
MYYARMTSIWRVGVSETSNMKIVLPLQNLIRGVQIFQRSKSHLKTRGTRWVI